MFCSSQTLGSLTDASSCDRCHIASMRLVLELADDVEPPSGWVEDDLGHRAAFVGILELISLLERRGREVGVGPEPCGR